MSKKNSFTPPDHRGFLVEMLLSRNNGDITDCLLADIEPGGCGAEPPHTHEHDHLFVVVAGKVTINLGDRVVDVPENCAIHVPGKVVHSVWNHDTQPAKMVGVNLWNSNGEK